MVRPAPSDVTILLQRLGDGQGDDPEAVDQLLPLIYDELRTIANRIMHNERVNHTLQPTALVHEVYLRMVGSEDLRWNDRAHFLALASRVMRRILVDHARRHGASKRAGGLRQVTLTDDAAVTPARELEVLDLDAAMSKLLAVDQRAGRVAEMRLFGGLTVKEIATALNVSPRTVDGDWSVARLWLSREIAGETMS